LSVYGERVYDRDGRELAVGMGVEAAGEHGTVAAIAEADVDWSDELGRAALVSWPVVTVAFDDGRAETFPVAHQPPRWMYDDAMRFVAEDLS
jgi:hypothetical protein